MNLELLLNVSGTDTLNIYPYGSKVYGTATEKSDDDFIIVMTDEGFANTYDLRVIYGVVEAKDGTAKTAGIRCSDGVGYVFDGTIYSKSAFEEKILAHEVSVLECLWLPPGTAVKNEHDFSKDFILDLPTLRESFSSKASNSFVKAKKKFTVEKDRSPYLAKKSLFHSLRILVFGMQIASYGRIINYSAANRFWYKINRNPSERWEDYKAEWQPIYNRLSSAFRLLAPKETAN